TLSSIYYTLDNLEQSSYRSQQQLHLASNRQRSPRLLFLPSLGSRVTTTMHPRTLGSPLQVSPLQAWLALKVWFYISDNAFILLIVIPAQAESYFLLCSEATAK